jgi:hypothetical protein
MDAWALCRSQIRVAPMGGVVGLDYAGCAAVLVPYDAWTPEVIDGLRLAEAEMVMHYQNKPESKPRSNVEYLPGGGRRVRF